LHHIGATTNRVSDLSPLVDAPSLEWIDLVDNPIDCEQQASTIHDILANICRKELDEEYGYLSTGCGELDYCQY
jgi:hypothetical protein